MMAARRLGEEEVHEGVPQGDLVPFMTEGNEVSLILLDMANGEIRESILALARVITTHVNKGLGIG